MCAHVRTLPTNLCACVQCLHVFYGIHSIGCMYHKNASTNNFFFQKNVSNYLGILYNYNILMYINYIYGPYIPS